MVFCLLCGMGDFRVLILVTSLEYKFLRIANTYDWIIATAASRRSSRICAVISTVSIVCLIDGPLFPSSVSKRCPAIMFAVRRTAMLMWRRLGTRHRLL